MQWLDQKPSSGDSAAKSSAAGGVAAARALFQSKATRGQESKKEGDELWTKHEAPIISLQPVPSSKASSGYYSTYSTSGRRADRDQVRGRPRCRVWLVFRVG